eukprot:11169697-Lingulodinium_polyedra.AAC.1
MHASLGRLGARPAARSGPWTSPPRCGERQMPPRDKEPLRPHGHAAANSALWGQSRVRSALFAAL